MAKQGAQTSKERARAARAFADAWAGRGNEKQDSRTFWLGIVQEVLGWSYSDYSQKVKFEPTVKLEGTTGYIDVLIPDTGVLVEQKSLGVDLDKPEERRGHLMTPFEQAMDYVDGLPAGSVRFVVVCDFATFRVHDLQACPRNKAAETYREFTLDQLGDAPNLLGFISDPANSRAEAERKVSIEAGKVISRLHDGLRKQYLDPDEPATLHALNVLCVRLVFCLFCEDAGMFEKDAFLNYLRKVEPENMRTAIKKLFRVLDTPVDERDPYDVPKESKLAAFPYVNGGLFTECTEVPNFTPDLKLLLLSEASAQVDWSGISPTIFGGIFESTLNPEVRAEGGMHYTSPENIHKVIDPLFMEDLYHEFEAIRDEPGVPPAKRNRRLRAFRDKIGSLRFLDPACGSGNFLTEAYLSLRRLEDDVLAALNNGQVEIVFDEEDNDRRVSLDQFYGIEVNDFACRVAKTALWIARLQANARTESMLEDVDAKCFPLREGANIVFANALRTDWGEVLPAVECDYVMGNPPFLGYSNQSPVQKQEMRDIWVDEEGKAIRAAGKMDYVSAWYRRACEYMAAAREAGGEPPRCAFVSTNSICQGEQVASIWGTLKRMFGVSIDFAHDTFRWSNEADDQAHVFCVIVGFSLGGAGAPKRLFHHEGPDAEAVDLAPARINAYLVDAPDAFVGNRTRPLLNVPPMTTGNRPADGGHLIIENRDLAAFVEADPLSKKYIRPFMGSREYINRRPRWCLWLVGMKRGELAGMPEVAKRVKACRADRKASPDAGRRKLAATPHLMREQIAASHDYLVVPKVSSERRNYIPMGYVSQEMICSDLLFVVPDATLYHFGVLCSHAHNAWMRRVCGRLKSDYRYSAGVVYNNFPWPGAADAARERGLDAALATPVDQLVAPDVRQRIEACAQAVLDAREQYPDATLAQLYDPEKAEGYPDLTAAHDALDAAVAAAYGLPADASENRLVAHLMSLYAQLAAGGR